MLSSMLLVNEESLGNGLRIKTRTTQDGEVVATHVLFSYVHLIYSIYQLQMT
jgi:hypothetical protein